MQKKIICIAVFLCFLTSITSLAQTRTSNGKIILIHANEMTTWGNPKTLPKGAHDHLLTGNPSTKDFYAFRFKFPANYKVPPFTLSSQSYVTVISGKLYVGEGTQIDEKNQTPLGEGSYLVISPNHPLYFSTRDEKVILQFNGIGPLEVNYVNKIDDPRNRNG